jgi:hypothetical protein
MESGNIEADLERSRREKRLPADIQPFINNPKLDPVGRLLTRAEAELVRDACSIPPVATMEDLSAEEMVES